MKKIIVCLLSLWSITTHAMLTKIVSFSRVPYVISHRSMSMSISSSVDNVNYTLTENGITNNKILEQLQRANQLKEHELKLLEHLVKTQRLIAFSQYRDCWEFRADDRHEALDDLRKSTVPKLPFKE